MTYMTTPSHKNPCHRGHEIYNFGRPFLGHHYYILGLCDLCLGIEKKIFKEIIHFHYMTYMTTPSLKNPCHRGHEIYNFGRPFLGHYYYILGLSDQCLGVEKKIFKEIMHFYYMTYKAMPLHKNPFPEGHKIYNFVRPFLGHHYYILGLSDLCLGVEKKLLKEIMHFYYMTYMATPPPTRTPAPGVMKFTFLVDPSLVIITTYLVCLIYAWELRRRFLKK